MSKKFSFSEFPEFESKVKKEKPKKDVPQISEAGQDKRHEKINFKQYLRGLQETQVVADEFADIPLLVESNLRNGQARGIQFDGEDGFLKISETDFSSIRRLEKDDSIVILDEFDDRWYVSRSLTNQIVFESQEYCLSGKFPFEEFIKALK